MTTIPLSVVLPFFNDEDRVLRIVEDVHQAVTARVPGSEIVAVDGGSRDCTWAALRELRNAYPELKLFRLQETTGYGACSLRGFAEANGSLILHREPHCPWRISLFWELARRRRDDALAAIFAMRDSRLKSRRERALEPVFRFRVLGEWAVEPCDPCPPLQLFSRSRYDKVQMLLGDQTETPGLSLALVFGFFGLATGTVVPGEEWAVETEAAVPPALYTDKRRFRRSVSELRLLHRNLQEIQGLIEIT